jgi:hypothetical protein
MRIIIVLLSLTLLNNCSNSDIGDLSGSEYLCSFKDSSNNVVDFSLKFLRDEVQIISWWIDRKYENLVVDSHKDEIDIFRNYSLNSNINIYKKSNNNKSSILLNLNPKTLAGFYVDEHINRGKVFCIDDPRASYKMSLKIAIGKKNYAAFVKQKGF